MSIGEVFKVIKQLIGGSVRLDDGSEVTADGQQIYINGTPVSDTEAYNRIKQNEDNRRGNKSDSDD